MAVDKLVDSAQLDADLTSVANAIRTKGGTSAQLAFPAGFVSAVEAIETGAKNDNVMKSVKALGNNSFENMALGTVLNFENLKTVGQRTFKGVTGPEIGVFPSLTTTGNYMFSDVVNSFRLLDFGAISSISSYLFSSADAILDVLILRKTSVVTLSAVNAFGGTAFSLAGSGGVSGAGGTLYVPSDLISSYQAATNWSTILGYTNNQILSIEGSIYETQYADGTPIA